MSNELGIALDLSAATSAPEELAALARRAEADGLDVVVVGLDRDGGNGDGPPGLDPLDRRGVDRE